VAVSLQLFASRAEELAPRLDSLHALPGSLRAAAAAASEYGAVHRPAAMAATAAASAHTRATEGKARNMFMCACFDLLACYRMLSAWCRHST